MLPMLPMLSRKQNPHRIRIDHWILSCCRLTSNNLFTFLFVVIYLCYTALISFCSDPLSWVQVALDPQKPIYDPSTGTKLKGETRHLIQKHMFISASMIRIYHLYFMQIVNAFSASQLRAQLKLWCLHCLTEVSTSTWISFLLD